MYRIYVMSVHELASPELHDIPRGIPLPRAPLLSTREEYVAVLHRLHQCDAFCVRHPRQAAGAQLAGKFT